MSALLAISWEPELRGVLTVLIAVGVLCGSIYVILATNLGIRLGFLVALAGLFGWMALMGLVWLIYGIGLVGPSPTWEPVPGRAVIADELGLANAGVFEARPEVADDASPEQAADAIADEFADEEWVTLAESDSAFGQASSRAGELVEETAAFEAGEYQVTRVFDRGGERYPKIGESVDFIAFFHKPHYAVAEVAPLEPTIEEPGRAPAAPVIDDSQPRQYVYMIRNLGAERQPATVLLIGATIILLALSYLLHRRDEHVRRNLDATTAAAG